MTPTQNHHKMSRWWYLVAFIVMAIESSIGMPLVSVGFCILLVANNDKWLLAVVILLCGWWLAAAMGVSWGGVMLLLWIATVAQRYLVIPASPSQRFMVLSLAVTLVLEWWRGITLTPSYMMGTAFSLTVLLFVSRLLYVRHQGSTSLVTSLSRFEQFLSK